MSVAGTVPKYTNNLFLHSICLHITSRRNDVVIKTDQKINFKIIKFPCQVYMRKWTATKQNDIKIKPRSYTLFVFKGRRMQSHYK